DELVAGELPVVAPVRLLDVLEDDVDLVRRRLADPDHRVGDRRGDLASLLVGASRIPLDRDVGHACLRVMEFQPSCTTSERAGLSPGRAQRTARAGLPGRWLT